MKNKYNRLFGALLPSLIIVCMILISMSGNVLAADPGYVDVTVYHHYDGIAAPVREDKQIEAGDYALSSLFVLTTDTTTGTTNYKVYEMTGGIGSELVKFEEGYIYTINIYYTRVYTVTFMLNNGTNSIYTTKTVSAPATQLGADMPANPSRSGYTFLGWNTMANGSGTAFTSVTTVDDDITVYAQWRYDGGNDGRHDPPATNPPSTNPPTTAPPPIDPPLKELPPIDRLPVDPPLKDLPQTGDTGLSSFYFLLLGISLIGCGAAMRSKRAYRPKHSK